MLVIVLPPCRDDSAAAQELTEQQQATHLQCYFLFSLVWSLGANTDAEGRCTFDALLRKLISKSAPPELAALVQSPEVRLPHISVLGSINHLRRAPTPRYQASMQSSAPLGPAGIILLLLP